MAFSNNQLAKFLIFQVISRKSVPIHGQKQGSSMWTKVYLTPKLISCFLKLHLKTLN